MISTTTTTTTTVVAVKVQKSPRTDFLTGDKFKYAPEKRLNGQSEVLVCALLTALSIPYSQTTWNSVPGFLCLFVRTFQNASSPSFLVRLS